MFEYRLYYPMYTMWDYEIALAHREVSMLIGVTPESWTDGVILRCRTSIREELLRRLTFFHRIEIQDELGKRELLTYQALIENTSKIARTIDKPNEIRFVVEQISRPMNGRKESRYATHCIHDYKGKFYPQLVKVLLNYLDIRPGQVVFDPFMGSGTTMMECYLNNIIGVGVDLNPLATLVAHTKLCCLSLDIEEVIATSERLLNRLKVVQTEFAFDQVLPDPLFNQTRSYAIEYHDHAAQARSLAPLPYTEEEFDYLLSWFPHKVLVKLLLILREIEQLPLQELRNFYKLVLSDIIRDCSHQEPRDLRIRRRQQPMNDANVFELFQTRSLDVTKQLVSFLHCRTPCGVNGVPWECLNGDVRNLSDLESPYLRTQNIDSIITSPPYATALPYLDTNRLSLAFLRLANKQRRRQLDSEMIGNREIGLKTRTELEQEFLGDYEHNPLPPEVKECIKKVYELNVHSEVGFRRKNMAALLYKYFMDMYHSMIKMRQVLKPGASIAIIIGNNLTKAGGEEVVIQTDRFLRLIGQSIGMRFMEEIPISVTTEDLAHVKHAIRENKIILLTKE